MLIFIACNRYYPFYELSKVRAHVAYQLKLAIKMIFTYIFFMKESNNRLRLLQKFIKIEIKLQQSGYWMLKINHAILYLINLTIHGNEFHPKTHKHLRYLYGGCVKGALYFTLPQLTRINVENSNNNSNVEIFFETLIQQQPQRHVKKKQAVIACALVLWLQ